MDYDHDCAYECWDCNDMLGIGPHPLPTLSILNLKYIVKLLVDSTTPWLVETKYPVGLNWLRLLSYTTGLNQLGYHNWTDLNQLYMVQSGFWKLRVQSDLVAVAVAPDLGPKTRLNWTLNTKKDTSDSMIHMIDNTTMFPSIPSQMSATCCSWHGFNLHNTKH